MTNHVVEISSVVSNALRLLRPLIPKAIDIAVEISNRDSRVRADSIQLQQVLINLTINARDAIRGCGRVNITTRNRHIDAETAARFGLPAAGEYAEIVVEDTGVGMPKQIQSKIFEPFFTTKSSGKGSGLGLATAYGIVRDAGGVIAVESTPEVGSVFRVFLPLTDRPASGERVPAEPGRMDQRTVLLVEDELPVRRAMRRILVENGHEVLEAENGIEGLRLAASYPKTIDALVTDVAMPRMGGVELAMSLSSAGAGLPVLFVTGHAGDRLDDVQNRVANSRILRKPFSEAALISELSELFQAPGSGGQGNPSGAI